MKKIFILSVLITAAGLASAGLFDNWWQGNQDGNGSNDANWGRGTAPYYQPGDADIDHILVANSLGNQRYTVTFQQDKDHAGGRFRLGDSRRTLDWNAADYLVILYGKMDLLTAFSTLGDLYMSNVTGRTQSFVVDGFYSTTENPRGILNSDFVKVGGRLGSDTSQAGGTLILHITNGGQVNARLLDIGHPNTDVSSYQVLVLEEGQMVVDERIRFFQPTDFDPEIHSGRQILDVGEGQVIYKIGNRVDTLRQQVSSNRIIGYGGRANVIVRFDEANEWTIVESDGSFEKACVPSPADGAFGVIPSAVLSWSGPLTRPIVNHPADPNYADYTAQPAYEFDVFFGTVGNMTQVVTKDTATTFNPGGLTIDTDYEWRVDTYLDGSLVATGDVWSFRCSTDVIVVYPGDEATGIALESTETQEAALIWEAFPSADGYNVYFSRNFDSVAAGSDAVKIGDAVVEPTVSLEGLLWWNRTYYWRVDTILDGQPIPSAVIYSFTTEVPACQEPLPGDLTGDCEIGFEDFAILASEWLECTRLDCIEE